MLAVENGVLAFNGAVLGRVAPNMTLGMGAGAVGAALTTMYTEGSPDPPAVQSVLLSLIFVV